MLFSAALGAWLGASLVLSPLPAGAENSGRVIFETKCIACHEGGGNAINPTRPLSLERLKADGYLELAPTVELLRYGKGQMPKYQGAIPKISRLTDEELELVAKYAMQQAEAGWPK